MMTIKNYIIKNTALEEFFNVLIKQGKTVFAPVKKNDRVDFEMVDNFSMINRDHVQTVQSPKSILFPKTEKLFSYKKNKEGINLEDFDIEQIKETVLWGIRPCDAQGNHSLSAVFNWDTKDTIFNERRRKTVVIAFSCYSADESCFCTSVGGNPGSTEGSDILFTHIGDTGTLLMEIITEKGEETISLISSLLENDPGVEKQRFLTDIPQYFIKEKIKEKLETLFESGLWVKQSMRCLGCGACAYVCPTCACFDIQDESHGINGSRVRCWDSCGLSLFTLHTSGHNPRSHQSQRWRQRLFHKFSYMPNRLALYGCTGCGRCSRSCPADMNILEHLLSIQEIEK